MSPDRNDASPPQELRTILRRLRRVLKDSEVTTPLSLTFGKDQGVCWRWVCEEANGVQRCGWRRVPC